MLKILMLRCANLDKIDFFCITTPEKSVKVNGERVEMSKMSI